MRVLSLFDGISVGQLALRRAGIEYTEYLASEIDKYALKVTQHRFPETVQLGDITKIDGKQLGKIDILIGGSPCQGFSYAGKGLNFDDPRSRLFFEFVRLLKEVQPKYFLLESVKMKSEWKDVITSYLGIQPILIDSALVSAQTRKRYYWANIPDIEQPEDRGILLSDIIESGVVDRDKSYCIDANYWKDANIKSYFEKHRRQLVGELHSTEHTSTHRQVVYATREVGRHLDSTGEHRDDTNGLIYRGYEVNMHGKSNALTSIQKDNYLSEKLLSGEFIIRKLTPVEYERLQTLPDNYTNVEGISNTQRYKMLGNSWNCETIVHILRSIHNG